MSETGVLRKAGRLQEALELGLKHLASDPGNIWHKRDLAWVYYDLMKRHATHAERASFMEYARSLAGLGLGADEVMLLENVNFQFVRILFDLNRNRVKDSAFLNEAFTLCKSLPVPLGTEAHGALVNAFIKHADHWHRITEFLLWADIEALPSKSFQPEEYNGTTISALVERACIAAGKELLGDHRSHQADTDARQALLLDFLPLIERLQERNPEFEYVLYYLAKLLHAKGDDEAALARLLPFARRKSHEFWVWQLMAHIRQGDVQDQIACLCKALTCKTKGEFLVKVRAELATLLISQKLFNEARTEVDASIEDHLRQGWTVGRHLDEWTREQWYAGAVRLESNFAFYTTHLERAEELLFIDQPFKTAIVGSVNVERRMVYYHTSPNKGGGFQLRGGHTPLKVGDLIDIKTVQINGKDGPYEKVLLHRLSDRSEIPGLTMEFTGELHVKKDRNGSAIGFVKLSRTLQLRPIRRGAKPIRDVFVPPQLLAHIELPGTGPINVRGKAMLLPKRQKEGEKTILGDISPMAYSILIE